MATTDTTRAPSSGGPEAMTPARMRRDVAALVGKTADEVGEHDDLIAIGLDSIGVMTLVALWRTSGLQVRFEELVEYRTIAEWCDLLSHRSAAPRAHEAAAIDESQPFDLATMQYAYWFGRGEHQALGVSCHYYFEFDGERVDPARLEAAVRTVVDRHGMLRARFLEDGRQQITAASGWRGLTVHDLRGASPGDADAALAAIRAEQAHRRLEVERGEGLDVLLSLLPGGRTRVHLNIDMLVSDALSFRIFIGEVARLYADPATPLPPLAYSYPRYLADKAAARRDERERARAYWQARLEDLPGAPQLPLAMEPEQVAAPRFTRRERWLSGDEWRQLRERAHEHGVTLPMALATAFGEVVAAWSAEPRFVLNVPLFDREPLHPDVDRLVGDFTNSVLLVFDGAGDLPFAERAAQVQARFRADAAHAAYAGVDVLRDRRRLHPEEPASAASVVFTSAVGLGDLLGGDVEQQFGRLAWVSSQTAQVWLDHQVTELRGGLLLNWDAVEQLFPPGVLDAMFAAYCRIVDWLCDPAESWSAPLPDLCPPGQRLVRARINGSVRPPSGRLLHDGFFAHASESPERLALAWGDDPRMSYGELALRARRVAGLLASRGIGPGDRLAVTMAKGPGQIEAVLGVLCAGAAYVPVAVEQPLTRRARIYASARIRGVLTTAAERATLGWPEGVEALALEDAADAEPLAAPVPVSPSAPAYVIFTSGSTGEPKGVIVPHRAAMNTIEDIVSRFALGGRDRVLAVSSLDFDWSVADIFELLSVGGAVVLISERERRDAARWADLVRRWEITLWQSVPALLDMLLVAARDRELASLRIAMLGGDWVGLDLHGRLAAQAPGCRLVALGGITETSIHCTVFEVTDVAPHWRSIPYGVPLTNVKCRVVDSRRRDCPDWVPGELWVGGAGVSDGYLGDPERTARQFVWYRGERWYRSGDLARYWPDGLLEFLGRVDAQVKILGHRIELGEIQAALEEHPAVARAIATTIGGAARRLAAAVAARSPSPDPAELRAFAAERLPPYMVPEHILVCDALPLSATDKIDRREVQRVLSAHASSAVRQDEPPADDVERLVAAAWSELLGAADVRRHDTFFGLGGDSLLATRLVARLRAAGVQHVDLRRLFAAPRLKDFAATLTLGEPPGALPVLVTDPAARFDPFPPTDVQRAYWLGRSAAFSLGGVGSHWYWEFDGAGVDLGRLEDAINRLVERHDMLRAVFLPDGSQRVLPAVPRYAIPIARPAADEAEAALRELRDTQSHRVPDLETWPLFDVRAVCYGEGRTRIAFSFDYAVLDALSIAIVFAELARLYEEPDADLPPIDLSFRDYVLGVRPDSEDLAAAKSYWDARIESLPPAPQLPVVREPSAIARPRFVRREGRVGAGAWRALAERARRHGLTPTAVVATAFAEVLAAWSSADDLTLVLTLFDRREVHPHVTRVVGDFTSLLLVPYQPAPDEGLLGRAQRFQAEMWSGLQHRSVSAISLLRDLARRAGRPVALPVVFTSTLGVADELVSLSLPFGEYVAGVGQTPQVWLDCQVVQYKSELLVNWDAVEELFCPGMLDAMFGAYLDLLARLGAPEAEWDAPVGDLLPRDQRAVRARVNATAAPRSGRLLHDAFFERAVRDPGRAALALSTGEQLTYGTVADRALRVGAFLRERGVRPGDTVAVALPKGADQVCAVLGVLAAGAAYVPVGAEHPPARRERIFASAGVRLVLDALNAASERPPLEAPVRVAPDSLAYVIYTSGSTGEPKGVEIAHGAAMNTIDDVNERLEVTGADRVFAVSALDFDLSVYDLFGFLTAGGAVVVPDEQDRLEPRRWVDQMRRSNVTIWNSVPALLEMLLMRPAADLAGLRLRAALVSGDWVSVTLRQRLVRHQPACRLLALGGATEASIWSNLYEVSGELPAWPSVPYGHPLRNQEYRVVDGRGRDRPDWVPGELWIGGAGVARGYRGDPDRTARQFVEVRGRRWYRTGDSGRYHPDGVLEFLGRIDDQVKVGGYRVEPGEIEEALKQHPHVEHAAAFHVAGGTRGLGAAVACRANVAGDASALRAFLGQHLPAYMIPDRLLLLDALPLTPNGKVDRQALRRLAATDTGAIAERPRGSLEPQVAEVWSAVLPGGPVTRHGNFFALGGDSLTAMQAVDALRGRLGVELSLREFMAAPTVAELAATIAARLDEVGAGAVEEGVV